MYVTREFIVASDPIDYLFENRGKIIFRYADRGVCVSNFPDRLTQVLRTHIYASKNKNIAYRLLTSRGF